MKTHTAIIGADGQRKITSTTEQLRIPASEILPGDWLLKPHRRGYAKDKLVDGVLHDWFDESIIVILFALGGHAKKKANDFVDVERTT